MESESKARGKYKKHKEGFKLTIKHKLNTSLKAYGSLFPVYVEIRVHGQRSYFRSGLLIDISESGFENLNRNAFAQSLFVDEIQSITTHFEKYYNSKDDFDIKEWLVQYRDHEIERHLDNFLMDFIGERIKEFTSDDGTLIEAVSNLLFGASDYLRNTQSMAVILSRLGVKAFDRIPGLLQAYFELCEILGDYSAVWLGSEQDAIFLLEQTLTVEDISDPNFLKDKLHLMTAEDCQSYLANKDILTKFINNII